MVDAGRVLIGGASPTLGTFRSDGQDKIAGNLLIDGAVKIEDAEKTEEAGWIAGAMRRGESGRLAEERTESAAAARTAATS